MMRSKELQRRNLSQNNLNIRKKKLDAREVDITETSSSSMTQEHFLFSQGHATSGLRIRESCKPMMMG